MDGRLIDVCIATIIYFVLLFYVKKQKGCTVIVLAIIFLFLSFLKVTIPTTYFWIFFAMTGIVTYEQFARFTYYTFYSKFWPIAKGKITHSGIKERSVRQRWNGILLALVGLFIAILGVWNGLFSEPSFFTFSFFQ